MSLLLFRVAISFLVMVATTTEPTNSSVVVVSFQWNVNTSFKKRSSAFKPPPRPALFSSSSTTATTTVESPNPSSSSSSSLVLWMSASSSSSERDNSTTNSNRKFQYPHNREIDSFTTTSVATWDENVKKDDKDDESTSWIVDTLQTLSSEWIEYMSDMEVSWHDTDEYHHKKEGIETGKELVESVNGSELRRTSSSKSTSSSSSGGTTTETERTLITSSSRTTPKTIQNQRKVYHRLVAERKKKKKKKETERDPISAFCTSLRYRINTVWSITPLRIAVYTVFVAVAWVLLRQCIVLTSQFLLW